MVAYITHHENLSCDAYKKLSLNSHTQTARPGTTTKLNNTIPAGIEPGSRNAAVINQMQKYAFTRDSAYTSLMLC